MLHVTRQLPENQGAMQTERIASGEFPRLEEYATALVDADAGAKAQEPLEMLLLEGLEGEATEMSDDDWVALHRIAAGEE